uniref:ferroxidase n=1 Tax=Astyanax mexicanus TaxID=7994 RepID=A0A8B9HE78_ASTMX
MEQTAGHPDVIGFLCCVGSVSGVFREYFIGIKEIQWDYAPSGMNMIQNKTLKEDAHARMFLEKGEQRIGRVYKKAVYLQYTDATFRQEIEKPKWMGYLGPLITAEEGDTVVVHLKNMASQPYSIHPHGMSYNKSNEGALYPDQTDSAEKRDDAVAPGKAYSYIWPLESSHAPGKDDPNCLTRVYHSHVTAPKDIATGLIGPLIICKKGSLDVHGEKSGDYLYALMFTVSDENLSWYLDDNIKTYCTVPAKVKKDDEDFIESNKMHSINGYVFGNLPDLSMCMGNKIHWHLFGIGNEVDVHSAFFHGQVLTNRRHRTDTVSLFPATFANVQMEADNPGQWLLSCQVNDHLEAGMQAFFEIKKCFPNVHKPRPFGAVRQYYIAAEEVIWDYGPTQINQYTGIKLEDDSMADTFFDNRDDRIGGKYKKVQYVEYTDDTFTKRKERTPEEQHLGILGPIIRAEEEDTIKVTFRNKASRPYSIQPHGVQYSIEMDGTLYHNALEGRYEWVVPKAGGPAAGDPDCISYLYYSAVDPIRDTNSGLVGPLLICKPKTLKSGKQKNVNKEFHILATNFDENLSWYLDENINRYAKNPKTVKKDDEDFELSNQMRSLNGYMYGNLKGLTMCKGDKVSWHLYGLGSEGDIHGLYFQGNRFLYRGTRKDTISVFPHVAHTVIMEPDSMGTLPFYQYICYNELRRVIKNKCKQSKIRSNNPDNSNKNIVFSTGQTQTYTWYIPKTAGPTEEQEECSVGAYYSTVDVNKDFYSGLIGPLVICKKSLLRKLGLKKEIEEFALLFTVFDENQSWYLDDNIKTHVKNPPSKLKEDPDFIESNKMHGINGLVYGNLPGLNMQVGDKVYWYLMGMGKEMDVHTAHFHGHSFEYKVKTCFINNSNLYVPAYLMGCKIKKKEHCGALGV